MESAVKSRPGQCGPRNSTNFMHNLYELFTVVILFVVTIHTHLSFSINFDTLQQSTINNNKIPCKTSIKQQSTTRRLNLHNNNKHPCKTTQPGMINVLCTLAFGSRRASFLNCFDPLTQNSVCHSFPITKSAQQDTLCNTPNIPVRLPSNLPQQED